MFRLPLLLLLCLSVCSGCEFASAATEPTPALWSSQDAQETLQQLRAIRQQEALLKEVRTLATVTNAGVATLTDRVGALDTSLTEAIRLAQSTSSGVATLTDRVGEHGTSLEGIEQRLDSPVFPPTLNPVSASLPPASGLCVTIDGIDYDLPQLIADFYESPWTWTGDQDAIGLKAHLAEHGVQGIDDLPFATLKKLHAAVHEKEALAQVSGSASPVSSVGLQLFGDVQPAPPPAPEPQAHPAPQPRNDCPNGNCPVIVRGKSVTKVSPSAVSTRSRSTFCPNGICPAPTVRVYAAPAVRVSSPQPVRSRGFFFRRWR